MQAVIMAGGKGTRLASVTKNIPKPMVPFCGKPLLVHQIENLRANGITKIIIIVGYLGDVIKDYFSDGSSFGVNISYFTEEEPLGTAGALRLIQDRLEDNFVLVFGDLYINIDFQRFWNYHIAKGAAVTLFAHPNSHPQDSDILATNDEMQVTEWSKKNTERVSNYPNLVNAGLYVVSKAALKDLPDQKKIDFEKDFILKLIPEKKVYAYHSSEYVKDIGTPERLTKVGQDYENHIPESRNLHHKQKAIFLDRDGTINKYVGFLRRAEDMVLEERAADAIKLINSSEYLAIVITNQPVIARGEVTFEGLKQIHNRMETLLGEKGAYIDGLYFCPHHPDKGFEGEVPELKIDCDCRKPKTGLIKKAVEDFNIDLSQCWMIGDTGMDVQTGINASIHTALLDTGESDKFKKYQAVPDIRSANLFEAVNTILSGKDH